MSGINHLRTVLIVQARMGSTRLPGKSLKEVLGKPLLAYEIERLRRVKLKDELVVATTTNPIDQVVADLCQASHIPVSRGSEDDVLDRYYQAAKAFNADVVVRVSGDCPLIDPEIVDQVIALYLKHYPTYQFVSNTFVRSFPRGMDVEVFSFEALEKAAKEATLKEEREHVTPYLYDHPKLFSLATVSNSSDESNYRLTVDTEEDFTLISTLIKMLYSNNPNFKMSDMISLLKANPNLVAINAHVEQKLIR